MENLMQFWRYAFLLVITVQLCWIIVFRSPRSSLHSCKPDGETNVRALCLRVWHMCRGETLNQNTTQHSQWPKSNYEHAVTADFVVADIFAGVSELYAICHTSVLNPCMRYGSARFPLTTCTHSKPINRWIMLSLLEQLCYTFDSIVGRVLIFFFVFSSYPSSSLGSIFISSVSDFLVSDIVFDACQLPCFHTISPLFV